MDIKVSVIIPVHNEEEFISKCLQSLIDQDLFGICHEIIVVDNNSTDKTKSAIESFKKVQYVFKETGPVGAVRNYGAKLARGDYLAFIDGDCVAPLNWICEGAKLLDQNPSSAFGGKYDLPNRPSWIEKYWLLGIKNDISNKVDLIGGTIFTRRSHFLSVGGFNEFVTSGEDTQLAHDLRKSGISVSINQKLNVIHLGNAKSIKEFINRQAWHSENYLIKIKSSIKDPTFIIVIIFMTSILLLIGSIIFGAYAQAASWILLILILPNAFSVKRVSRAKHNRKLIKHYHKIFIIDLIYLVGRSIGVIRGLRKLLRRHP